MATALPFVEVYLTEEDVPGAKLLYPTDTCRNSVVVLKRFLRCRKLKTNGRKEELVKRVEDAIQRKIPIYQGIDNGSWLSVKESKRRKVLVDSIPHNLKPPAFPLLWKKFPSNTVPEQFFYGHIYQYLITSCVLRKDTNGNVSDCEDENKENDYSASKPLEYGRQYLKSGHVLNLQDAMTNGYYCLKSDVHVSYGNATYPVMAMLDKNANVVDASCECKASAMGRCAHVAAILFALENYVSSQKQNIACTSKLCTWNQGRKEKKTGLAHKNYKDVLDHEKRNLFDPRKYASSAVEIEENKNRFLSDIRGTNISCWELLLMPPYQDYDLCNERKDTLKKQVDLLKKTVVFGAVSKPISVTHGQGLDENWMKYRKVLITASTLHEYHMSKTSENFFNLVKKHLYQSCPVNCDNFEYGRVNEAKAYEAYEAKMQALSKEVRVEKTGLWINLKYPGLGASPDGLVTDPNEFSALGLLEIKCPKVLQYTRPSDMTVLTQDQQNRFCCTVKEGKLYLKKSHKYYTQIQIQMGLTERLWCDFVVWTPTDTSIERVFFDEVHFIGKVKNALQFYDCVLAPEYFEQRVPRRLTPFILRN